jgi:hypothetical protein
MDEKWRRCPERQCREAGKCVGEPLPCCVDDEVVTSSDVSIVVLRDTSTPHDDG